LIFKRKRGALPAKAQKPRACHPLLSYVEILWKKLLLKRLSLRREKENPTKPVRSAKKLSNKFSRLKNCVSHYPGSQDLGPSFSGAAFPLFITCLNLLFRTLHHARPPYEKGEVRNLPAINPIAASPCPDLSINDHFTASLRALPDLNFTTLVAGILISLPV
jgi:hypothetical protein